MSGGDDGIDAIIVPLGGFGKFQIFNLLYYCLFAIFCAVGELSYVFTSGEVKHRCLIPECGDLPNGPYDQPWLSSAIPKTESGGFQSCLRYNSTGDVCGDVTRSSTYECSEFVYETSEWTIAREDWGIHCDDDRWMLTLLGSLNNVGQVVGGLFVGYLADRFGRKKTTVACTVIPSVIGTIKSFSVNFPMMATLEFFEASMVVALFTNAFILSSEIVAPNRRALAGAIISIAYPTGEIIIAAIQWLTLDWRTTVRIMYPPFLLTLILLWVMPESVRWLVNNKRNQEALDVFRQMAKTNGKDFTPQMEKEIAEKIEEMSKESSDGRDKKAAFMGLLKSPKLRIRVLACFFLWIANTFVYFGLTLNSTTINDNKFLNFILTALIEVLSYVTSIFIIDRLGRRITQSGSILLCAAACLLFAFVPEDDSWSWAKLLLFLIGKYGSSFSYIVMDMYTTEMFPTSIRASTMSLMLTSGKLAAIVAPQSPLLSDIYKPLPLLLFSGLAFGAGLTVTVFPETLNVKLPDSVEEAEKIGENKENGGRAWSMNCCRKNHDSS